MADTIYDKMARAYARELTKPLQKELRAREIIYFNKRLNGLGYGNIDTYAYTEMGDANTSPELPDESVTRDAIQPTTTNIKIWTNEKSWKIPRDEFESFKQKGILLDTNTAQDAIYQVSEREEAMIIDGWSQDGSAYDINGLYQGAGGAESTSKDFGTYGNALDKTALAMAELDDAGVRYNACNMVLNKTQYSQLRSSVSTNGTREMTQVLEMMNERGGNAGKIIQSSSVSADTGLLVPVDPTGRYFQVWCPQDIRITVGYDSKLGQDVSPIYGTVFERIGMDIRQSTAVIKLTNI